MAHVEPMKQNFLSRGLSALILFIPLILGAPVAKAQTYESVINAQLLPGWRMADGSHMAALELDLDSGWKTYWRSPGDVGIPPQFDWRGSRNLSGIEISWPTPKQMDQGGITTIGYSGKVTLPLKLTPTRNGKNIRLKGILNLGVCREVCVPVNVTVSADLPRKVKKPDPRIAAALADRAYTAKEAGVSHVSCVLSPGANGELKLRAEVTMPKIGGHELAIVETDNPQVWVAPSKTRRSGNLIIAETELVHVEGRSFAVNRSGLRITVLGKSKAVDIQGCPAG